MNSFLFFVLSLFISINASGDCSKYSKLADYNKLDLPILNIEEFSSIKDYYKSLDEIKQYACNGVPSAEYILGYEYYNGVHLKKDIPKAIYWLNLARSNGVEESIYYLGKIHSSQNNSSYDISKAIKYFEESLDNINLKSMALFDLGVIYQEKKDNTFNISKSINYYKESSILGNKNASYNLANIYQTYYDYKDLDKSIKYYMDAIDGGHKRALNNLGVIFLTESGYENYPLAYDLFLKSYRFGNSYAGYYLGIMNTRGIFIDKDIDKGKIFLIEAFKSGVESASKELVAIGLNVESFQN